AGDRRRCGRRARHLAAFPWVERELRGIGLDPDIPRGIGTVGRVRELRYAVLEDLEGVPGGGEAPLVAGGDGRIEGSNKSRPLSDRIQLVDPRATAGAVRPDEQQPSGGAEA